jgi:hypothetical protein
VFLAPLIVALAELQSEVMAPTSRLAHADAFPKRMRGEKCNLAGSDLEELHNVLITKFPLYVRVFQECARVHGDQNELPGAGIRMWNVDSNSRIARSFQHGQSTVSLRDALRAFRCDLCRKITSGVWHAGEKRQGCLLSSAPHRKAYSVFQFVSGDEFGFGRILYFFEYKVRIPGTAPQALRLAKVQVLHFVGLDPKCKLPVISMHPSNREVVVEIGRIGKVIVCARHPDENNFTAADFLHLPWPRHAET